VSERITIEVSHDKMLATIVFNLCEDELVLGNQERLIKETVLLLREKGIVFGVKSEVFLKEIECGKTYIIAEGIAPEAGIDSVVTMLDLMEAKPEVIDTDRIDYYNLSLITTVNADTWLGERLEATEGKDGRTVTGEIIKAKAGIQLPLYYDRKTVYEKLENNKTVLYSREYGAVYYEGRDIALMNPLIIDGDVDFKTGNIIFDGCVIIKGTICDGFYVEATENIEVNGELGLGNIKGITSKKGSIFVKGGILTKGGAKLEAGKNVYVKFVENAVVNCGGTAHIGFYSSNSVINAKEVVVDSADGKIMGGSVKALTRVTSPIIGSETHRRTVIEITGFNRELIKAEMEALNNKINSLKNEYELVKLKIHSYSNRSGLSAIQDRILNDSKERLYTVRNELKQLHDEKDDLDCFLKARGDGEIIVSKRVYPNTAIIMKNKTLVITTAAYAASFVTQGGRIIQV
jgi:uncharacterized protein